MEYQNKSLDMVEFKIFLPQDLHFFFLKDTIEAIIHWFKPWKNMYNHVTLAKQVGGKQTELSTWAKIWPQCCPHPHHVSAGAQIHYLEKHTRYKIRIVMGHRDTYSMWGTTARISIWYHKEPLNLTAYVTHQTKINNIPELWHIRFYHLCWVGEV